jgi:ActR/RegA family two-component response regulator
LEYVGNQHRSGAFFSHATGGTTVVTSKVLVVDDDKVVSDTIARVLEMNNFDVTVAQSVPQALKLITNESFDVLLSDLHMPGAGDGLTVISAMRHANPDARTILLTAFPAMDAAAKAILLQADEILVKPMGVQALVDLIEESVVKGPRAPRLVESVATVLERSVGVTIEDWFDEIQKEETLMAVPMSFELRCGHLPQVFRDLVTRLRSSNELGSHELVSSFAADHGTMRRRQRYTAAMIVEESRRLQVSIFKTLQNNLSSLDFRLVLMGVMTIADEVDSQLSQAMKSYAAEAVADALPA